MKCDYRFALVARFSSSLVLYSCVSGEMVTGGGTGGKGGSSSSGKGGSTGSGQGGTTGSGGVPPFTGNGGTNGSGQGGTVGSGQGGTVGSGQGGTVGTTGAGGSSSAGCTPMAPSMALITDFSMTSPGMSGGAVFTYKGGGVSGGAVSYGTGGPMVAMTSGAMTLKMNTAATAAAQYVGASLYFDNCVDASAYKGIKFSLGGTLTGCTMQYSTNDSEHTSSSTDTKGSCVATSCYAPQKPIDTIPASPSPMTVLWGDATNAGAPSSPVDPAKLTSIQWQFTIAAGTGSCSGTITIDDISFTN